MKHLSSELSLQSDIPQASYMQYCNQDGKAEKQGHISRC